MIGGEEQNDDTWTGKDTITNAAIRTIDVVIIIGEMNAETWNKSTVKGRIQAKQ